jgi:hypothetical protein
MAPRTKRPAPKRKTLRVRRPVDPKIAKAVNEAVRKAGRLRSQIETRIEKRLAVPTKRKATRR